MPQQVGSGSTSDRDNLSYLEDGDVFYNTETGQLQVRKNDGWTSLTKTITDTNAFKITSGTSLPSGTTTTTTTTTTVNTDLSYSEISGVKYKSGVLVYNTEQHFDQQAGQSPVIESYDLTTFGTNSGSLIGSDVYVYLRYEPGNGNEGDVQISQIKVNDVLYGINEFNNDPAGDFYYTKWQTTYRTNNYDYRHGNTNTGTYSGWTASWLDLASGRKNGSWCRDDGQETSSGNTGVIIGNSLYYENSSGGRTNQGVTSVFLRTPKITLTSNTIEIGSLRFPEVSAAGSSSVHAMLGKA